MAKYRKKPVVIDALQLLWDNWNDMCEFADVPKRAIGIWVTKDGGVVTEIPNSETTTIGLAIKTPEGTMIAKENDWIIRGVNGELYPCKPDIFEKTYEPVTE